MLFNDEPVIAAAAILGLWMVGVTHLRFKVMLYGLQTVIIGGLAVWIGHQHHEFSLVAAGCAVVLLKGVAVPIFLRWLMLHIGCRRDEGLVLSPPILLLLTVGALAGLFLLRPYQAEVSVNTLAAIGILLIGMVLMVSRRLAVSQIMGFLVLENGIFYYTISQPHSMPFLVEMGMLLDILVATMIAGLIAFRINDSFEHIDVTALSQLRG